jgi:hypothetical protein
MAEKGAGVPSLPESNAKRCRDCGQVKPATEFWRRKQSPDGLALYCKECFGLRNAETYRGRQAVVGKRTRPYRRYSVVPEGMKYCANCGQTKPRSEFGANRAKKSGLANYCRPCHNKVMAEIKRKNHGSTRSYHLKRRYGLTAEQVAEIQYRQLGSCLICLSGATLHVDHDHATGVFRGLLCFNCNNGLGQFRDDAAVLRQAADYLNGVVLPVERVVATPDTPDAGPDSPTERPSGRALARHYRISTRYGIGLSEVTRMIEAQGGVCAVCRRAAPRDIDHDHDTGAVRGILCSPCNTGMGQFKDDPRALRRAAAYLDCTLLRLYRTASGGIWVGDGSEAVEPSRMISPLEVLVAATIKEFGAN